MKKELRDKIEGMPVERQKKIQARTEEMRDELKDRYQLEEEIKKLRAENVILHEEIRLREIISWRNKK